MGLLKPQAATVQAVGAKTLADSEIMNRIFRRHGINLDEERQRVLDEEEEKKQQAIRIETERLQREAEQAQIKELALKLIADGHMVVKIDGERVEDLAAPCPACGTSLTDVGFIICGFAEKVWRGGGTVDLLVTGEGAAARAPLSLTIQKCPKCKTMHRVTVQLVL